jgi:hypothetical protein
MWYHGYDAYYEQQALEYELGYPGRSGETLYDSTGKRRPASERPIPLRWVAAWIGGLSVISLGLGLASQWLLQ